MRWLAVVALVGCAAPESAAPTRGSAEVTGLTRVTPPIDAGVAAPADAALPLTWTLSTTSVLAPAPVDGRVVNANHGSAITVLAVSEDGRVAVTADGHSVRLWPSLDGKREPVVVAMRTPLALAVERDVSTISIAGIDAIGQLEIVTTSLEGAQLSRVAIESPRPIRSIYAASIGVFAVRDDGGIALYHFSGSSRGELPPVPRQRLRALAVRDNRALALLEIDGKLHGRWVELAPPTMQTLRWGAETAAPPFRGDGAMDIALSPDGLRAAGTTEMLDVAIVFDLQTGRVLQRYREEDEDSLRAAIRVVGFIGSTLVLDRGGMLGEWKPPGDPDWRDTFRATLSVVSDRGIVGVDDTALVIAAKGESEQYLAYQTVGDVTVVPRGNGFLASNFATIIDLGANFRVRRSFELGTHSGALQNPAFVDGDHLITAFAYGYENPQGVFFADVKTGEVEPLGDGYPMFNADTGVLLLQHDKSLDILRYDRKKKEFGAPLSMDIAEGAQIGWLAPARGDFFIVTNGGRTSLELDVVRVRDKVEITQTKDLEPDPEWFNTRDITALIDDSWRPRHRRPSPDKALVADVHAGRMTLSDAAGEVRWVVPATGIDDVVWTARGELVAFGSGIARVDVATGALRDRQCGWQFGLWPERPTRMFSAPALCEAP